MSNLSNLSPFSSKESFFPLHSNPSFSLKNEKSEFKSSIRFTETIDLYDADECMCPFIYSVIAKVGSYIAWPFVKIYQIINNLLCSCCCRSKNIFVRFFRDPERTASEFENDPLKCADELLDNLINEPEKSGKMAGRILLKLLEESSAEIKESKVLYSLTIIVYSLLPYGEEDINELREEMQGKTHEPNEVSKKKSKVKEKQFYEDLKLTSSLRGLLKENSSVLMDSFRDSEFLTNEDHRSAFFKNLLKLVKDYKKAPTKLENYPLINALLDKVSHFLERMENDSSAVIKFLKNIAEASGHSQEDIINIVAKSIEKYLHEGKKEILSF